MDLQESDSACGKAVVRQVLKELYGFRIGEYVSLKEDCSDFSSMTKELERREIRVSAFIEMSFPELLEKRKRAIIHLERGEAGHFVLIKRIFKNGVKVTIYDPEAGEVTLSAEEAERDYTGRALLIESHPNKPVVKDGDLRLAKVWVLVMMGFLSLIRALCALLFFAMLPDSETSLGALIPLLIFLLAMGATCWLVGHENSTFVRDRLLPLVAGRGGKSIYQDAIRAHSLEVTSFEMLYDSLALVLLVGVVYCFQDGGRLLLFLGTVVLFTAVELFSRNTLARAGSISSYRERRMVFEIDEQNPTRAFKKFRRVSNIYLGIILSIRVLSYGLVAIAVLAYTRSVTGATASDFVSDFLLLSGAGLSLGRILKTDTIRSERRLSLYRLGHQTAEQLNLKGRKRGYNPPTDDRGKDQQSADVR